MGNDPLGVLHIWLYPIYAAQFFQTCGAVSFPFLLFGRGLVGHALWFWLWASDMLHSMLWPYGVLGTLLTSRVAFTYTLWCSSHVLGHFLLLFWYVEALLHKVLCLCLCFPDSYSSGLSIMTFQLGPFPSFYSIHVLLPFFLFWSLSVVQLAWRMAVYEYSSRAILLCWVLSFQFGLGLSCFMVVWVSPLRWLLGFHPRFPNSPGGSSVLLMLSYLPLPLGAFNIFPSIFVGVPQFSVACLSGTSVDTTLASSVFLPLVLFWPLNVLLKLIGCQTLPLLLS